MKNLITRYKWVGVLFGSLLIVAGVLIIIFSLVKIDDLNLALSIVVATLFFIIGAVYITAGLASPLSKYFDPSYVLGAIAIALGVVMLVERTIVPKFIVYIISISLISFGVVYLIRGILLAINKMRVTDIVLTFIIAALSLTVGILCLCFQGQIVVAIYITGGAILVAAGIAAIIYTVRKKKN